MKYDENTCLCALNRIFGFNPGTGRAIIGHFGSAEAVFAEGGSRIKDALPFTEGVDRITDMEYGISEKELGHMLPEDCRFIGIGDKDYPALLRECADAPLGIYVRSASPPEEIFNARKPVAVIGTRDMSLYGQEWCGRIVSAMADTREPPAIVSGLAIGVDITAHRKALECGIPTIGVMATGIDGIYPSRHKSDGRKIAGTPYCALVTDYPPGTVPRPVNFLRRNRIIAGMCGSAILIESRAKGGGMMTARLAFGYSRDVFALLGRADDLRSQGCNILIKERIAEPITDTDNLLENLGMEAVPRASRNGRTSGFPDDVTGILARIILIIKQNRGIDIDSIADALGTGYSTVSGYISMLEADGIISVDLMRRCHIRV